MTQRTRIFQYISPYRIEDYLVCGWCLIAPHGGTALWIVEWLCDCPIRKPEL